MKNFLGHRYVFSGISYLATLFLAVSSTQAHAAQLPAMTAATLPSSAVDVGALPSSQAVTVTLHLVPTPDREAALEQFLANVQTAGSTSYRQWLTPAQFAQQFGATPAQLADVQTFAAAKGLMVGAVSASGLRVELTGSVAQMESAMTPALHQVQMAGKLYYANTAAPALPSALASDVAYIDGLDTVPAAYPLTAVVPGAGAADGSLASLGPLVDANGTRLVTLSGSACVEDFSAAEEAAMETVLRQAAAQGITVLAQSGCNGRGSASFPAVLPEVTAVAVDPGITPAASATLTVARPAWQWAAQGLPADSFRHEPDVTVSSVSAFSQTLVDIMGEQPTTTTSTAPRLGAVGQTLYQLQMTKGLYAQPDNAAAGTWEAATGLGVVDLHALKNAYPHVGGTATETTLTLSLSYAPYGTQLTFTVQVYTATGGAVNFGANETVTIAPFGFTVQLSPTGYGTYQTSAIPVGTYSPSVTYNGDATYGNSTGTGTLTVAAVPLKLALGGSGLPGNATFGSTFGITVTATGASGDTPSGSTSITIAENGPTNYTYTQTVAASGTSGVGQAVFTIPALQANSGQAIPLQITCTTTDANYSCGGSGIYSGLNLVVHQITPPTSSLVINPTSPTYGQSTSLNATFGAPPAIGQYTFPQPTGYVTITDTTATQNNQFITGGNLSGGVYAGTSTAISGTVNNAFTASYPGDSNYLATTATASTTGNKIATTIAVNTPTRTTVVTGGQATLTATISLGSVINNLNPTGTVQFYANGAQIGQAVQVSSGTGLGSGTITVTSAPITFQTIGTDAITATYSGDTNYATSTSTNTMNITVGPLTAIALTSNATNNVAFGGSVTITAAITATPTSGSNVPTGNLVFSISGGGYTSAQTQTVAISSTSATAATSAAMFTSLPAGSYSITATCNQTNFDCSSVTVNTVTVTVSKAATTTTLVANPSTFTAGETIALTATIAPTTAVTGVPAPTGTVQFYDSGTAFGGPATVNGNSATATGTVAGASDNLTAVYSGDTNYLTSTGTLSGTGKTTAPVTTTTGVSASVTAALYGSNIILTASVSDAPSATNTTPGTPGGSVTFYDTYNGQQVDLGTATLVASGPYLAIGQISTTGLLDGTHNIIALFSGSSTYVTSSSTATTINIYDYSVSFSPTSLTISQGSSAVAVATITAINGFTGQVSLSCTPPAGTLTGCSFTPSLITTSGPSQLLITTTPAQVKMAPGQVGMRRLTGGIAVAMLLFGFLLPGARRRRPVLLTLLVSALLLGTMGCTTLVNNNAAQGSGNNGTPLGTQIFTITTSGTDGRTSTSHNTQIQVTVH